MATDGPDPKSCNKNIFKLGHSIAAVDGSANAVERWVKAVAKKARSRVDWHYSGGIANVLHLGDMVSRGRVVNAIKELEPSLRGRLLKIYAAHEPGLYRRGVTQAPKGAMGGFMGPDGNTSYI